MPEPRTTLIIPNYNGVRHLRLLWPSIAQQTRRPARVLLVDNGSTDGSHQLLPHGVELLALPDNLGFAAAVNRGLDLVDTPYVAILNNDVVLHEHWLEALEDALDHDGGMFACPLLLAADNQQLADGAYDLVSRSGCAARVLHRTPVSHPATCAQCNIQFPPMTAALFRNRAFSVVGPLNEHLESYYEDVEWGLRAAAAGCTGIFVPRAEATHFGSATLGKGSARATFLISRNQLLAVAATYPNSLLLAWWWPIVWGNLLFLLGSLHRRQGLAALHGKLTAVWRWPRFRRLQQLQQQSIPGEILVTRETSLRNAILESERNLQRLAQDTSTGYFWRVYFRLAPPLPTEPHNPGDPTTA